MPVGNTLGVRKWFKYTSDAGTDYSYLTDLDLGTAAGATQDATLPNFPRRFKPRVVFLQATIGGKVSTKSLIIPTNTSAIYTPVTTQNVTIDTTAFATTGRKGEQVSFPSNA
jgi:hypothetical protein